MNVLATLGSVVGASLLLFAAFTIAQVGFGNIAAGFNSWGQVDGALRALILTLGTILGVVSRGIYDEIETSKARRLSISRIIRNAASAKGFWMGIIISPILILAFYDSVREIPSRFLIAVMAYQNGFFFRSVMSKRAEPKAD